VDPSFTLLYKGGIKRNSVPKGGKDEIHKVISLVDMHVSQLYILYTNKYMKKKSLSYYEKDYLHTFFSFKNRMCIRFFSFKYQGDSFF
jgi:hypothetical protein